MQQKLAVLSVLALVLLGAASIVLIQAHVASQNLAGGSAQAQTSNGPSVTTTSNSTSTQTGGSLLTSGTGTTGSSSGDDGGTEAGTWNSTNPTMDD